jgi:hypothetical protein
VADVPNGLSLTPPHEIKYKKESSFEDERDKIYLVEGNLKIEA